MSSSTCWGRLGHLCFFVKDGEKGEVQSFREGIDSLENRLRNKPGEKFYELSLSTSPNTQSRGPARLRKLTEQIWQEAQDSAHYRRVQCRSRRDMSIRYVAGMVRHLRGAARDTEHSRNRRLN
jgi:hypothetical protein